MATSVPIIGSYTGGDDGHDHDHDHDHSEYTDAMIYGYGTASVAIISCLAVVGITLFPSLKSRTHGYFVQFFIALGVGTMTADALIHIIPEVLGLHSHATHTDEHQHAEEGETESDHSTAVWKMSVVFGGVFAFFLFENALKVWKQHRQLAPLAESSQDVIQADMNGAAHTTSFANGHASEYDAEVTKNEVIKEDVVEMDSSSIISSEANNKICWRFTTVMLTVFIGDILHNVADGMAIGVSFAASATSGIGTSIAVLCHELPHEYGDFAIYLKNGATKWQAIGLNFFAAITAFIGLYIGIAISSEPTAREWLLALIAGMFLYIALVQVMVELVRHQPSNRFLGFGLQIFGLLLGWTFMLLLGLFEEDIESSIGK